MKISDLIKELETIKEAEGDIPVALSHWNAHKAQPEVESLDMQARWVETSELSKFSRDGLAEGRTVVFF